MAIIEYISAHWVQWLFAGLLALLGWGYRTVSARLKAEQAKNEAIAEGVQALLRESIVETYNRYKEQNMCPLYTKQSAARVYEAYHKLGGNDVATELYNKILKMGEE